MEKFEEMNLTINEEAVEERYACHTGETQNDVDTIEDYIEEA